MDLPNEVACWVCCHYREICRGSNANIIVNNVPSEGVLGVEIVGQIKFRFLLHGLKTRGTAVKFVIIRNTSFSSTHK